MYSEYSKRLYKSIDHFNTQRAKSAQPVKISGLNYKFSITGVSKYQDKVRYGNFNWPIKYSTVGKKVPNPENRKKVLVQEIHFDTLQKVLKMTDWAETPVFQMF